MSLTNRIRRCFSSQPLSSIQLANTKYRLTLTIAVLFVIAVVYFHNIQHIFMISDEYLVYRFTRGSLQELIGYLANNDVHPPLWFSFFWGWRRLVGDSDFAGRSQAILFSLMTLSIVYHMGKRWFGSHQYGIFAAVILSVSALFFWYSLEIRPYAFAMFLATLSIVAFERWIVTKTMRAAAIYALSIAMLLYTHYFLFLFILVQVLYFLAQLSTRRLWNQAFGVGLLVLILWSPWLPNFIIQFNHIRAVELAAGNLRGLAGSSATTQPTSLESITHFMNLATNGQIALYGAVLLIGFVYRWRKPGYQLALVVALGVPVVAFALNTIVSVYSPRYILSFVVALALVLAAGLQALIPRLRWPSLIIFAGISIWALPTQLPKDIVPYRILLHDLIETAKPGDVVFFDRGGYVDDVMKWVWRNDAPLQLRQNVTLEVQDSLKARRIWHVTADWFDDTVQANFKLIEQTHPRQSGFGDCNRYWCYLIQLMEAPPWASPEIFGSAMTFWGADVDSVTAQKISTRLWWMVAQTPYIDYSISLRLLDAEGNLVSQSDGPINHYGSNIVSTSQLEPDRIYIDFRALELPPNLNPGTYRLSIVVYNWQTNERQVLADGTDELIIENIRIPGTKSAS